MAEAQVQAFPIQLRQFVESKQTDLASTLPKQIDPERFLRVALLAVTKNKALWECSKESVFLAIMESARVGLQIDNKEAALIPYGGHAEFMPMVQGIIRLMLRSPGLTKVEARVVREGDQFEYRYGLDPQLEHKPVGGSDRPITHAYAVMVAPIICWELDRWLGTSPWLTLIGLLFGIAAGFVNLFRAVKRAEKNVDDRE